jgi:hypothetical protein
MAGANILGGLNFFMPIFSFLFVFIVIYAVLAKTKVFGGENKAINLAVSLILAVFFIVNLDMQDYLKFNAAWVAIFIVCFFLIILLISFTHGKVDMIMKPAAAWTILAVLILFFIISSTYFFSWTLNWGKIWGWFDTQWFGFFLLLVIAGVISWILPKFSYVDG